MYVLEDGTLVLMLMHHALCELSHLLAPIAIYFFNGDNGYKPACCVILVCLWNGIDAFLFVYLYFLLLFHPLIHSLLLSLSGA